MKLTLSAIALVLLAAPAFAAGPDAATLTCKDFVAADAAGMTADTTAVKAAVKADAKLGALSDADLTTAIQTACKAHADAKVVDALKM